MNNINDYIQEKLFIGKGFKHGNSAFNEFKQYLEDHDYRICDYGVGDDEKIHIGIMPKDDIYPTIDAILNDEYLSFTNDKISVIRNPNAYGTKPFILIPLEAKVDYVKNPLGLKYTNKNAEYIVNILNKLK